MLKFIPRIPEYAKSGFLLIGFFLVFEASANTFHNIFRADPKTEYHELVNFVKQNTELTDVFLNLGDYELSFSRKTRRDEFVVYKFVPFGGSKIYEWYSRFMEKNKVWNDLSEIKNLKKKYKLDYFICDHAINEGDFLRLVFQNKSYCLYKIL